MAEFGICQLCKWVGWGGPGGGPGGGERGGGGGAEGRGEDGFLGKLKSVPNQLFCTPNQLFPNFFFR